jgi:flagellar secretion chaperone FliS
MTNPRTSYRESDVRGASAVRLVVLLHEQVIQDLRHAVKAMEQNNIELRARKLNHALDVIACLQASVNKEAGRQVALTLESFYNHLRVSLLDAHVRASPRILSQQITDLLTLREAWIEVDRAETAIVTSKAVPLRKGAHNSSATQNARADWNG